jgi:hypothetical protein
MYSHNGYFHPIAGTTSFQPIPQLMLQSEGLSPNEEQLSFINEQMILNEAKAIE